MSDVLRLESIAQRFRQGESWLDILRRIDLTLSSGELVALVGPSGAGKSTLLHITALLERQSAGEVVIQGKPTSRLADRERTSLRRRTIGFVYQFHHLLPDFTALENVTMPQLIAGRSNGAARSRSEGLLARLGLKDRLSHRPAKLSGGEQQRVAIARALANDPALLLADEPTGNLDPATADQVFDLLLELTRESDTAALIATHNHTLAGRMDRTFELAGGQVQPLAPA